mgnify:CR=1 FL=1
MSHYTLLVCLDKDIIPKDENLDNIGESILDSVMEPFSENKEMEPYKTKCHCSGRALGNAAHDAVQEKFGEISYEIRKEFYAREDVKTILNGRNVMQLPDEEEDQIDNLWEEHAKLKEREAFEKEFIASHPELDGPDPECDSCEGTGERETTYNPDSKWDWFVVGGRWDGLLHGKNIVRAIQVKDMLEVDPKFGTFACLTKDGEWVEKGEMGWFAHVANKNEKFSESFKEIITNLDDDDICALVDCHI